jgi:DNA polymerase (family 10)
MPAYDNSAVAARLDLYADLLEISGADKFRFLAYRRAASSIQASPEQVATLAAEHRLTDVPGVGAKMARTVEEIVASGSFEQLDRLAERIPPGLARVMSLPGVGPKRASLLHERLGITDIEGLAEALSEGRVERLGGFGAKTAEKIAASLEQYRRLSARTPLATALPTADSLAGQIAALPGVDRVEVAGSVRRRADAVGNIDIVVAGDPGALEGVVALPAVERVLDHGAEAVAFELHSGLRADVRVVEPQRFELAKRYWTGSLEHNRAMAARAVALGYVLGPTELTKDGRVVPVTAEGEVFRLLGMQPIPPEAREGSGTVAAAIAGTMPKLVEPSDVRGDLQTHSTFTDGRSSLAENRAVAAELGYDYIAATDHAYELRMVGGLGIDDLERQWAEIDKLNDRDDGGPRVLKGIELNIAADGSLDYDDDVIASFDVVLASLHSGWDEDEATVTRRMLAAVAHPLVDIIAHPTGRILGRREPMQLDMPTVLQAAGETGTIMEINSYPDRLDLSDAHIKLARGFGVRFSLGTDAHAADQLRYMPFGVAQARRGLVTADELLNSQPWDVARTWLKRYRVVG